MPQIAADDFFEQLSLGFQANDPDVESKQREAAHVRRIQLLYHAIARRAFDEALALTTDDFVLEICGPAASPFNGRWQGREEVLAAMKRNFGQVKEQRPQIQSVVAQGDIVILTAREQGTVCATGKCYDVQWMQEFTFVDGKIQRVRELIDRSADMGEEE